MIDVASDAMSGTSSCGRDRSYAMYGDHVYQADEVMAVAISGVDLGFYPWRGNGFDGIDGYITEDQATLDVFAAEYGAQVAVPSMADFLLIWLPGRIYDIGYAGAEAPAGFSLTTDDGIRRALWFGHVTGWNVGVFARTAFR